MINVYIDWMVAYTSQGLAWFGHGLFNVKAIIVEEQLWYYLTHSWEDKGIHTFAESEHNSATGSLTHSLQCYS